MRLTTVRLDLLSSRLSSVETLNFYRRINFDRTRTTKKDKARQDKTRQDKTRQDKTSRGKAAAGPNDLNLKVEATDSGVCPGVFKRIENSELSTSPTPLTNILLRVHVKNQVFHWLNFWVVSDMLTLPLTHVAQRRSRGQPQSRHASTFARTPKNERFIFVSIAFAVLYD